MWSYCRLKFRAQKGCMFFFKIDQLLVFRLHDRLKSGYFSGQEGGSTHPGKLLAQINPWHVVDFSSDIFLVQSSLLAYSRHTGNLNWPISIQQVGKTLLSWHQCKLTGKASKSGNISHEMIDINYSWKGIENYVTKLSDYKKWKMWNIFCLQASNLVPKMGCRRLAWQLPDDTPGK